MIIIIMLTIITMFTIIIIVFDLFCRNNWCICDKGEVNPAIDNFVKLHVIFNHY